MSEGFQLEHDETGLVSGITYQGQAVLKLVPGAVINTGCQAAVVGLLNAYREVGQANVVIIDHMLALRQCVSRLPR
jgi:hypothetical protein